MPKLKPSEQEEANRVIKACIANNMELQAIDNATLARLLGMSRQTIHNKWERPETFTAKELCRLGKILKFTPFQAASIILGRQLTAKEVRDFILL